MMIDWDSFKQNVKKRPHKTLRFVGGLAITLTALWILVLVQANSDKSEPYVTGQTYLRSFPADTSSAAGTEAGTDSLYTMTVTVPATAKEAMAKAGHHEASMQESAGESASLPVMPVFLSIGVIGGGIWLWAKIRREKGIKPVNGRARNSKRANLKLIDELPLGGEHTLQAVEVGDSVWLIGCFDGGMNVLEKVQKDEWSNSSLDATPDSSAHSATATNGFAGIMKKVTGMEPEAVN